MKRKIIVLLLGFIIREIPAYQSVVVIRYLLLGLVLSMWSCSYADQNHKGTDIIIENAAMRLVLGSDGTARNLIHKASGQECLMEGVEIPAFSITQKMPYDNEIKLAYPAKQVSYGADTVYKEDDHLIVGFELTDYEAIIRLNITNDYIGFTLEKMVYRMARIGNKLKTPLDEFTLLQLPVKDRSHFGDWLNVLWDEDVAVNLLATDPCCRIDAESKEVRAFIFEHNHKHWVVYWHVYGEGKLELPVQSDKLSLFEELGQEIPLPLNQESTVIPAGKRRYIQFDLNYNEVIDLFARGAFPGSP
ncbi:MAG: hypothetical protein ABFS38_21180 [Bacteroidota bacterium]